MTRDEKIKMVCHIVLDDHTLCEFCTGVRKHDRCECVGCQSARELLADMKPFACDAGCFHCPKYIEYLKGAHDGEDD